jgi:purine catabolism regulator
VLRLLLHAGEGAPSPRELDPGLPDGPLVVAVAAGEPAEREALAAALEEPSPDGGAVFAAADGEGRLVVLGAAGGRAHERLAAAAAGLPGVRVGESSPVALTEVARGYAEAVAALAAGVRLGRRRTAHADVGGAGLLALVGAEAGRAFAASLLGPLLGEGARGELLASLRCWLEHNGHWDAAAAALGVHRHTLRARLGRVEQLLGRDLGAAGVRAELWTALQLLDSTAHR